jgi:GNAT superfamily N-acetyltransferase
LTVLIQHIQNYLREKARAEYPEVFPLSPFMLFRHDYTSYAFPDSASLEGLDTAVAYMRAELRDIPRLHYVSFLDEFAPSLASALQQVGFDEIGRRMVMMCRPETLLAPPDISGVTMVVCSSESRLEEVKEGWLVNSRGFGEAVDDETATRGAEAFRRTLTTSRAFTARLDGVGVAAGMYTEIRDGLTELAGITTLEPYRGRGIAGLLTATMTRTAFENGVEIAFLVAVGVAAGRVYARVGFRPCATLLEYKLREA